MENLNDVEFGSDKGTEEAPILAAQRYLNIFRQIHIFNKDKRRQFDDELLALPQTITDFFKRMPGGRLLVEHIEDVKTERGISFVKSNKEDFTDGADLGDAPARSNAGFGGNLVMDASFAESLASSMASAFKQAPMQGVSGGTDSAVLANLNKTFQLIAEEIKMSRNSLLEVLRETRQITDSVISSQMAISQLLENLCSGSQTVSAPVLPKATTSFTEKAPYRPVEMPQVNGTASNEQYSSPDEAGAFFENVKKKKKKKKHNNMQPTDNAIAADSGQPQIRMPVEPDLAIKSEKIAPAFSGVIRNAASKHFDDFSNVMLDEAPSDEEMETIIPQTTHNSAEHMRTANFSQQAPGLMPDEPHSDTDGLANLINGDSLDFALPEQDTTFEQSAVQSEVPDEFHDLAARDDLDFTLPEQNVTAAKTAPLSSAADSLDSLEESDGLDFALPEQGAVRNAQVQPTAPAYEPDSFMSGDGLDFALPEQSTAVEEPTQETGANSGLDSLLGGDGLDFALPEQSTAIEEPTQETGANSGLDRLLGGDGLDFALPEQSATIEEPIQESAVYGGLDDLLGGDALPEQDTADEEPANAHKLDSFADAVSGLNASMADTPARPVQNEAAETSAPARQEQHSRYSEELDKIRAALTSDNVDISSIDQPIALDDYSDDENVSDEEETDFSNTLDSAFSSQPETSQEKASTDDEWEWEYVDENGNPIEGGDGEGEDWEWEYVEDDGEENAPDNNNQ